MLNEDDLRSNRGDRLTRNGPIGNGAGRVHNETTCEDGYVDDYGGFHPDPPERDYATEAAAREEREAEQRRQWDRQAEENRARAEAERQRQKQLREKMQQAAAEEAAQKEHSNKVILFGVLAGLFLGEMSRREREQNQPQKPQQTRVQQTPAYNYTPKPAKQPFQRVHIPKIAYAGIVVLAVLLLFSPVVTFLNSFTIPWTQGVELADGVVMAAGIVMAAVSALISAAVGGVVCFLVKMLIGK